MTEKIIRKTIEDDLELLIKMYLDEVEDHRERAKQFAEDLICRSKTIVCICGENILGSITWDTHGGLNDGIVELLALGVNKDFRRQGIARELLLTLINEAKRHFSEAGYELRVIYIFVERNNEIAQKFYKSMGFHIVSEIPAFYPHDDALFWIKHF